jgi:hypothetical protein
VFLEEKTPPLSRSTATISHEHEEARVISQAWEGEDVVKWVIH